jgi:hypothetical protein
MTFFFFCRGKFAGSGRMMEGVNLIKIDIVNTYVNTTMYPPVQLLYANNNKRKTLQWERVLIKLKNFVFNTLEIDLKAIT